MRVLTLFAFLLASFCTPAFAVEPTPLPGSGPQLEHDLPSGFHRLKIGDAAPDFRLTGTDDAVHTLAEFEKSPYLLVVFLSNHCPFSHAAETRLLPWIKAMRSNGLAVVAIQPNHPDALSVDELGYSKYNDSFEEMKLYALERGFDFPYLYDGDTQQAAEAYGALATPHLFLFDKERRLRYSGRFDNSRFEDPKTATLHEASNAFDDLVAGRPVATPETRPMGCSVKWKTKIHKTEDPQENVWPHEPITVELIDAAGVAALRANPTSKLRLINVWATWCGPCVQEFPELTQLSRRLKKRDFELITLSLDTPQDRGKVLKFLQKHHAGMPSRIKATLAAEGRTTNNYLFSETTLDKLLPSLDPEWPGPTPYTLLVAPGGKILWRHAGVVDPVVLSRRILDELGGYYPEE